MPPALASGIQESAKGWRIQMRIAVPRNASRQAFRRLFRVGVGFGFSSDIVDSLRRSLQFNPVQPEAIPLSA